MVFTERIDYLVDNIRTKEERLGLPVVFAVEGPVCAGKSTLIDAISDSGQTERVLEYSEYVKSATLDFPQFPPKDEKHARKAFTFFLELEKRRLQDYLSRKKTVLLDRSVFTLLGFEAGASSLTGINILPWAFDRVSHSVDQIILPDHVIYMDVPVDVSKDRAVTNKIRMPSFQFDAGFNAGFRALFFALKKARPDYVSIVNATNTQEVMQTEVLKILSVS